MKIIDNKRYIQLFKISFLIFFVGGLFFNLLSQFTNITTKYPNQSVYPMMNIAGAFGSALGAFIGGLVLTFIGYGLYRLFKKIVTSKISVNMFISIFSFVLIGLYISGMYLLWSSNKYTSKQLIGGLVFPPYSVYIGGKDLYDRVVGNDGVRENNNFTIKDYAEHMNKDLPKMIEKGVQAQSVEAIKKDTLLFKIKLTDDIPPSKKEILRFPLLDTYCYGEFQPFFKAKINLIYVFRDKTNEILSRVELTPKQCD